MSKEKTGKLEEMKASENATFHGVVSLAEKDIDLLRTEIKGLLEKDSRAKIKIESLCKTEKTFSNSLGNIHTFLKDRQICQGCKDGLSFCPKKRNGFCYDVSYDETRDEISLVLKPCPYQREMESVLSKIAPRDIPAEDLYSQALRFLKLVQERPEMKDVQLAYGNILLSSDAPGKDFRGLVLTSLSETSLPQLALSFGAYFFAKNGIDSAYVDLNDLLLGFRLKDPSELESVRQDWVDAGTAKALFIRNIDVLPRLSLTEAENFLFPLLQARNQEGKVTFSTASDSKFLRIYRNIYYNSTYLDKALEDVEAIGKVLTIRDILL